jgi:hypothetical protein
LVRFTSLLWVFATDDTPDSTRNQCRYHQLASTR